MTTHDWWCCKADYPNHDLGCKNSNDRRWESGFRQIVGALRGPRAEFEIKDIVAEVIGLHERRRRAIRWAWAWRIYATRLGGNTAVRIWRLWMKENSK